MAAYAGDSFGQASALFNADDQAQRAAAADAWNQMLQRGMQRRQMNQQQNQFVAQLQAEQNARQQQAAYQNRVLGIDAQHYGVESQWRNRQLDLMQRQLQDEENNNKSGGGMTAPQRTNLHLTIAQQDAAAGFPHDPPQAQIDADYIKKKYGIDDDEAAQNIADTGNQTRAQMQQQFEQQSRLAQAGQYANRIQRDATTTPANPNVSYGFWNPLIQRPDTSWVAPQADRVNAIRMALAAAQKQGQLAVDPVTGQYSPAMARPIWMAAPGGNGLPPADRSMAGGFAQPTVTGTNLPLPTMPPIARSGVPAIAPARVYRDKSGARWQYVGQMADPTQDTNAANWQQMQ